jgi:hypothetical protein
MISTNAGGVTSSNKVMSPSIAGATPGMSITDQAEGSTKNTTNPRSQHPASGNLIAQIVAKAQEASAASNS